MPADHGEYRLARPGLSTIFDLRRAIHTPVEVQAVGLNDNNVPRAAPENTPQYGEPLMRGGFENSYEYPPTPRLADQVLSSYEQSRSQDELNHHQQFSAQPGKLFTVKHCTKQFKNYAKSMTRRSCHRFRLFIWDVDVLSCSGGEFSRNKWYIDCFTSRL